MLCVTYRHAKLVRVFAVFFRALGGVLFRCVVFVLCLPCVIIASHRILTRISRSLSPLISSPLPFSFCSVVFLWCSSLPFPFLFYPFFTPSSEQKHNWVPRRKQDKAKTLDDIRKEAEAEARGGGGPPG